MLALGSWLGSNSIRLPAYILFFVSALAPLPFGSRNTVTVALWCAVLGVGLVVSTTRNLYLGHALFLAGMFIVALCFALVLHEQLSANPWIATPNPIWAKTSQVLGRPIQPVVSVVRDQPYYALGGPLSASLSLALGIIVGAERSDANRALYVVGWAALAYAVLGMLTTLAGLDTFFTDRHFSLGYLTATFVNRNTAATYFGSCSIVWLLLFLVMLRSQLPSGPIVWSEVLVHVSGDKAPPRKLVIHFAAFFVCLAALFMTGSRGGVLLSLFVMTLVFVTFFRREFPRGKSLITTLLVAGMIGLALLQFLGGKVESRIDTLGLADAGRLSIYETSLRIAKDYPWFGTGLGTFPWILPLYRRPDVSIAGIWDIAHSTPLELAVELGIPLALIIVLGHVIAMAVLMRGTRLPRRQTVAPLVGAGVLLLSSLHSSIDFSLQVTGYAVVAYGLVGLGLGQSLAPQSEQRSRSRFVSSRSPATGDG